MLGRGPWRRPAGAARGAARTAPGVSQDRQSLRNKLPRTPSTTRVRGGQDRPCRKRGTRPADAEHSGTWEALGSGEKAGCEGGSHDPQCAGTGASGGQAGQLQSQPTRTAARQTTGRMQFSGIPRPQRRLHRQARRRTPRPLTWLNYRVKW